MLNLENDDLLKIIARRDARFDGRFLFGVTTTKIYCRPICPAKPKRENIRIFRSAAEAEREGFRACLRCRPELAPGHRLLDGTLSTVSRALRLISESTLAELTIPDLAEKLGVTDRHLRRLFKDHLGASPVEIMMTNRLHYAKQLVQSSTLPLAEVAYGAGFQSLRRFNEAFKDRFGRSPSHLRRDSAAPHGDGLALRVSIRPPYDWAGVLAYLQRHECGGIERIEGGDYQRFVETPSGFGIVTVALAADGRHLLVRFRDIPLNTMRGVLERVKRLFDSDHNPAHLPTVTAIAAGGVRVPGSFDPFEGAVSIIISQLVSTSQARNIMGRLVCTFGRSLGSYGGAPVFAFPTPAVLATVSTRDLGLTQAKAGAIQELSRKVVEGTIHFSPRGNEEKVVQEILAVRGIGAWTAAMISMRCLGNPDAFPKSDLIIKRAIDRKLVDPDEWRSSRAYLTHCLWRDYGETLSKVRRRNT